MKTNHTPGPWRWTPNGQTIAIDSPSANYLGVAFINPLGIHDAGTPSAQDRANAHLIAAAPELLEACEYVARWHREHDSGEGELFGLDFVTTCIAAIRKAKGE